MLKYSARPGASWFQVPGSRKMTDPGRNRGSREENGATGKEGSGWTAPLGQGASGSGLPTHENEGGRNECQSEQAEHRKGERRDHGGHHQRRGRAGRRRYTHLCRFRRRCGCRRLKARSLEKDRRVQQGIVRVGDDQLDVMAHTRGQGYRRREDRREAVELCSEGRWGAEIRRIVVLVKRRIGGEVDCIDRHGCARPGDQSDVLTIDVEGKDVVERADELVVLVRSKDIAESNGASRRDEVELENRGIEGRVAGAHDHVEVRVPGSAVGGGNAVVRVRARRVRDVPGAQDDAARDPRAIGDSSRKGAARDVRSGERHVADRDSRPGQHLGKLKRRRRIEVNRCDREERARTEEEEKERNRDHDSSVDDRFLSWSRPKTKMRSPLILYESCFHQCRYLLATLPRDPAEVVLPQFCRYSIAGRAGVSSRSV